MAPVVYELEQRYAGKIGFVYLATDDPAVTPWAEQMQFIARPHFFLLDAEGNIVDQWVGPVSKEQLIQALDAVLAEQTTP